MVKGISRRVVVVDSPDQRYFEQAIFIVRNDAAGEGVTARDLVEEAKRVARNYAGGDHGHFSRAWRDLSPAVYTLLGAGGLVRAYTEGAAIAVRAARPRVMSPCTVLQMDIDYGQYGKITYILPKYHTVTLESDFGAAVRMQILIKDKYIESFRKELTELTSATVVPYELEHRFDEIPE